MKKLLILLCLFVSLFSQALPPEDVFKFNIHNKNEASYIEFNLDSSSYLYKNELKIHLNNDDITHQFDLGESKEKDGEEIYENSFQLDFPKFLLKNKDNIKIYYQGCSKEGLCYQPLVASFTKNDDVLSLDYANKEARKIKNESKNIFEVDLNKSSYFIALISFFFSGLLLSLTPCTLPMVPIISSILAKSSGKSPVASSIVYVIGMAISYTAAGIVAASIGSGVQEFFQNPYVIIAFSLVFVLLALSMFGLYELKMPNFIINSINSKSSKLSGIFGVFIMGVLSALIVGPCIAAPLAGILIYIANSNDLFLGGSALFAMSLGMGLPLVLIGFGFKFITGAWMQEINKFFAFLLLAMAVYFLERIVDEQITNTLYAILGICFCVFCGLFETSKSVFKKVYKIFMVIILIFSNILIYDTYFKSEIVVNNTEELHFMQAKTQLKLEEKNILYFTAKWCENCKIIQRTTFKDKEVINALNHYNLIKIDLTKPNEFEQEMAKKYQVFGPPVLIIVDKQGRVEKQIIGLVDAKTLLKELDF